MRQKLPQLNSTWFNRWLELTGGSESPPLFNFWSGASAIAACLGRRWSLKIGRFTYTPNMYVILTGPPAVRKSSAGDIAQRILRKHTGVKFGPNDTAGQRQGLIASFIKSYEIDDDDAEEMTGTDAANIFTGSIEDWLSAAPSKATDDKKEKVSRRIMRPDGSNPPSDLFIFADELGTFVGMNQLELVNCLTELFYPKERYEYALARRTVSVDRPGLNLLACTTPTSLTTHLPPTAIGQGFSSRAVFVYCGIPGEKIFPAPPLDEALETLIARRLTALFDAPDTVMTTTDHAMAMLHDLYMTYSPNLEDSRFTHYEQRRLDHLVKLCMVIAAADGKSIITDRDVADAHAMLAYTEQDMSNALGELGLTKQALARQHLKDLIESSWPHGLALTTIKLNMARDMTAREVSDVLVEYEQKGLCIIADAKVSGGGSPYKIVIPVIQEKKVAKTRTKAVDAAPALDDLAALMSVGESPNKATATPASTPTTTGLKLRSDAAPKLGSLTINQGPPRNISGFSMEDYPNEH